MPLVGIGTLPTPFSPASVPLPPETGGRGHTSLRVWGWGETQFRRGAYTVVLFICTYFVELDLQSLFGLHVHSFTHWLKRTPPPAFGLIDDISLWPPQKHLLKNYIIVRGQQQ